MNKAFEKILERLEETSVCEDNRTCNYCQRNWCPLLLIERDEVEKIVNEVSEEYNNGWIACSERLPEKNGMYLCTQNSYDLATNKNIIRVSTELVEFYNGKWRRAENLVVTHWQPLPEPYQPKGE